MLEAATIQSVTGVIRGIVSALVPFFAALALLYFIWGMVQFISQSGSEEGRAEGRQRMIWGVVGLFCIVAVWGLVGLIADTFNTGTGGQATTPQF